MNPTTQNEITFSGLGNPEQAIQTPPSQQPVEPITTFTAPTAQETQNLNNAQTGSDQSFEQYSNALFGGSSQEAMTLNAGEEAGIPQLNKDLTDIENQLRQTDLTFRRERERLQTEPGLTNAQRNARLSDVTRKQSSQLADLEVIRQARSNVLFNAESLVQKKVAVQFAEQERNIEGLKFLAERADGKLKTQLDAVAKKEERAFQLEKDKFEATENEKIQLVRNAQANGASNAVMSAIMQSKNIEEAYKNAGSFGVSIDDRIKAAQLRKINTELAAANLPVDVQEKANEIVDKITNIDSIKNNKIGLKLAVGPTRFNRMAGAIDLSSGGIGSKQDFIASVEQLTSEETLNSLINAKAKGATFGALSEGELALLKQSASKIGKWAIEKNGRVVGYAAPESSFLQELDTLQALQIKAYEKATGLPYQTQQSFSVNPQTGAIIINAEQDDASFWNNQI